MKILLIEDDEWIRDSLSLFFETEGCHLRALETAEEGLAKGPTNTLAGIKRLRNYSMKDLRDYLSFESQELMKITGAF